MNLKSTVFGSATALVIAGLVVAMSMVHVVPAGSHGVQVLFGDTYDESLPPGLHIINPFSEVLDYDTTEQTLQLDMGVPSQDKLISPMTFAIYWNLTPGSLPAIKNTVGTRDDVVVKKLRPLSEASIRELGKGVAMSEEFYLAHIQEKMQLDALADISAKLSEFGVNVTRVEMTSVQMPSVIAQAIVKTKQRQQEEQERTAQVEIAKQDANMKIEEARGRAGSAEQDAIAKRHAADAVAYEILEVAKAQSKANELLSESLTAALVEYKRIERWDGAYPSTMLGNDSSVLLGKSLKP